MGTRCFTTLVLFFLLTHTIQAQYKISGELRKWHKITLTFDGPNTSENASPNPFSDYRLNVTFTNGSTTYVVPGYYAADGNAANSGSNKGNKWRVHFAPDKTGTWDFKVSFRKGSFVAVSDDPNAGSPVSFHGTQGSFNVQASNKGGRDHRGKGRLEYVGKRYLRFAESGEYFIKTGADSPENFLAYAGFDNTTDAKGLRKSWGPHEKDWNSGDPTWKNGKGKGIIGAINYLSGQGQNVFSFLTLSIEGDDRNVFPFIGKGSNYHSRYDVSKLDQWEVVFEHADKMGMYLHFKTQETENDQLLDNGALGKTRKLYYRELIARFGHHLALNWNMGEESTVTDEQRIQYADYFHQNDPYRHHVVVHSYPYKVSDLYPPLLGNRSEYTGMSLQARYQNVHAYSKSWVNRSGSTSSPWVVASDESGPANIGVPPDGYSGTGPTQADIRGMVLWGNLMAGGAGVEYYFGYSFEHSDLTCQDYRSRSNMWKYNRIAANFFRNHIPFTEMGNRNALVGNTGDGNGKYCFAKPGEIYAVYTRNGSKTITLDLGKTGQAYEVRWYDPRNGGSLETGSVKNLSGKNRYASLGSPPSNKTSDWVILVKATGAVTCPAQGTPCDDGDPNTENDVEDGNCNCAGTPIESDQPDGGGNKDDGNGVNIWLEAECAEVGATFEERSNSSASNNTLLIVGNVSRDLNTPPGGDAGRLTFTFDIAKAGTYHIFVRAATSGDSDDSFFVKMDQGSWFTWNRINYNNKDGKWHWDQVGEWTGGSQADPVSFNLSSGSHTLILGAREEGVKIDKIKISSAQVLPEGKGGDAPTCGETCPAAGTSCDDGNPNTENDVEDGNCNCEGTPIVEPDCAPAGTACDDGNPSTQNDVEDGNCNCEGTPGSEVLLYMEAECGDIGTDWIKKSSSSASNQTYLQYTSGESSINVPPSGGGSQINLPFYLPVSGNVQIFARVQTGSDGGNSLWVRVDDGEWIRWNKFNSGISGFAWAQVGEWDSSQNKSLPVDFSLSKGNHTLSIAWRQTGVRVDKVFVTNQGQAPSGMGGDGMDLCGGSEDDACPAAGTPCNDGNPDTENDVEDGNCNCEGTPANKPSGTPTGTTSFWMEAECASHIGFTWKVVEDENGSQGYTLRIPSNSDNLDGPSEQNRHLMKLTFSVPEDGDYKLFVRSITPNPNSDSFWFNVDDGSWELWPRVNDGNFTWDYQWDQMSILQNSSKTPVSLPLKAGTHTITFSIRESDIFVDKFFVTNENKVPSGFGGQANGCNPASIMIEQQNGLFDRQSFLEEATINTYPNPTVNKLTVEYTLPGELPETEGSVLIMDMLGRTVRNEARLLDRQGRMELDVSRLPSGNYLLLLIQGEQRLQRRFIKAD